MPAARTARPTDDGHRPRRPWLAWAVAAVVSLGGVVVLIVTRPATEPPPAAVAVAATRPADLVTMMSAADALARDGQWRAAYDGYARVLTAAAERGQSDPVAVGVVAEALAGQERAVLAMTGAPSRQPTVVAAPTTAAPQEVVRPSAAEPPAAVVVPPVIRPSPPPVVEPIPPAVAAVDAAVAVPRAAVPSVHRYAPSDVVTDEQVGGAMDRAIAFLAGRFRDGQIVTGLPDDVPGAAVIRRRPPVAPPVPAADAGDLAGGSALGDDPPTPPRNPEPDPPTDPPAADPTPTVAGALRSSVTRGAYAAGTPWASAYSTPGIDALAVYALVHAGRATRHAGLGVGDPFTVAVLDRLKRYALRYTYHRSLRAAALAVHNRPADRAALEDDVRWLIAAPDGGAYTYTAYAAHAINRESRPLRWDNSNSQYGLLGVWAGADAGVAVPADYWRAVEHHWSDSFDAEHGTWGYLGPGHTLTMTCGGIASMVIARDYLDDDAHALPAAATDRPTASPLADAGLANLDAGDACMADLFHPDADEKMGGVGYGLYGLERVGLATGYKYFGDHDWYAELAARLVREQHPDGSWGGAAPPAGLPTADPYGGRSLPQTEIDTAYCLLFLARGRPPILFNKLRHDGVWNDRPRDVAHLARFAAGQLERPLNWQVVNGRRDWSDWLDAPVLYLAGDRPPVLSAADEIAMADYARGGGLIFTHADDGSPAFTEWVRGWVARRFPGRSLVPMPPDHPLYSALYRMSGPGRPPPPPLLMVSNGSRVLLVHSPTDLAGGWQLNWTDANRPAFELGTNVFAYAAGRTDYRNRLASTYVPTPPGPSARDVTVARLRYAGGDWDPEPYAWTRFARLFQWDTGARLAVRPTDLADLTPGRPVAAFLTGTAAATFTPAEAAAARRYVDAGGVLVVDACGGSPPFARAVRDGLLRAAFPDALLAPLPPEHPLRTPGRPHADDLRQRLAVRPFVVDRLGQTAVPLEGFRHGRGWVILSPLDLTTGLLGTGTWGVLGYDPPTATAIVKNAILWADARAAAR